MKLKFKTKSGDPFTIEVPEGSLDITGVPQPTVEEIYSGYLTKVGDTSMPRKDLTSLRTSLVRVAQAAGVDLSVVGLLSDPPLEQIDFQAKHRLRGWNTLCSDTIDKIETLKQMNKGLHADLDGMVAATNRPEDASAVRCIWADRTMLPEHLRTYVRNIYTHFRMDADEFNALNDAVKKALAQTYDRQVSGHVE